MTAGVALTWGASFLFIATALDSFKTGVVPIGRLGFGALALSMIPAARKRIKSEDIGQFIVFAVVSMTLPFYLYPLAAHSVSSSVVGMINGSIPLTTALFTAILIRRMPSGRRIFAVLTGFSGIALISFSSIGGAKSSASVHGVIFLLLATSCYAITAGMSRELQMKYGTLTTMLWTEIIALTASLPLGIPALLDSSFSWTSLGALFMLGAFGTGFAYLMHGQLLLRAGSVRGLIGVFFTPVIATILGIIFRNETVTVLAIIGMCIVIFGAWLTSKPESRVA